MNAAEMLATVLKDWREKQEGQTIYVGRDGPNGGNLEFWVDQLRVAALLDRVRLTIDDLRAAGEDVSGYEEAFPQWARILFAPDIQWNSPSGRIPLADSAYVAVLSALGHVVKREPLMPALNADARKTMRGALDDVVALLGDDECPFSPQQKAYVLRLVSSIRNLLDEVDVQGSAGLASHINELYGYLTVVAKASDTTVPGFAARVRAVADRVIPIAYASAMFGMAAVGTIADLKAIGG